MTGPGTPIKRVHAMKNLRTNGFLAFFTGCFLMLFALTGLGCPGHLGDGSTSDKTFVETATGGSKLANAAGQASKVELAKPKPDMGLLMEYTEVVIASTTTADQKEKNLLSKLAARTVTLSVLLEKAEKARKDAEATIATANARADEAEAKLASANRRPLYWVAAVVGGVLILGGGFVAAGGSYLGITSAHGKGITLGAFGAATLSLLIVVDSILDTIQLPLTIGLIVVMVLVIAYGVYRWWVQGKTLAVAVKETDKLLGEIPEDKQKHFLDSAGRTMDSAHKAVVKLAREAGLPKPKKDA